MNLLVKQLCNVNDLIIDLAHPLVGSAEVVENVGLRQADIDTSQIAYVANISRAADSGDWQNTQIVAVIEHVRKIVCHLQIGIVRIRTARYKANRILVGLLILIDADAHEIIAHSLDISRFIFDRFRDRIEPAVVAPAVSGRSRGNFNELLDHEFAVLILEIKEILAPDRRSNTVGNTKTRQLGDEGIKVAIGKPRRLVVDRSKSSFRSFLLEFFLHALEHRQRFFPGAKLSSTQRERRRSEYQDNPKNDDGETHCNPHNSTFSHCQKADPPTHCE